MSLVNPDGYGAPFVSVFMTVKTKVNDVEVEDKQSLSFRVTKFSYKYSDEEDHEANLTIETDDVNLPDHEGLQEGGILTLIWGYRKGLRSPKREVVIRDIVCTYNDSGLTIKISAFPKASILRDTIGQNIFKEATVESVAKDICDAQGIVFKGIDSKTLDINALETTGLRSSTILEETGNYSYAIDNTSAPLVVGLKIHAEWPQANKSDRKCLEELCEQDPNGPFVIEGKDDELIIRKRDLTQKPIRTYTYGKSTDGELLMFEPETKSRNNKHAAVNIEASGWDALEKVYHQGNINQSTSDEPKLGDLVDGSVRGEEVPQDGVEPENGAESAYPKVAGSEQAIGFKEIHTESASFLSDTGNFTAAVDTTRIIMKGYGDISDKLPTVEQTPADIAALAANQNENALFDKNPGTAEMIGDPRLENGQLITITGVAKKYKGNYYIKEIVHNLTPEGGYTVRCLISTNAEKSSDFKSPDKITFPGIINKEMGPDFDIYEAGIELPEYDENGNEL